MTNEEIEAARGWIRNGLLLSELPQIDKALLGLDALCAAASHQENTQGFDDWLDASPEWVGQIDRLEDTGHRQLIRRAMQAAWGAASQPESLVGKRVKGKNWPESNIGHIIDGPLFKVDFGFRDAILDRDDFELLEADDAE